MTDAARDGHPDRSEGYKGTVQNTRGRVDRIGLGPIDVASPEVVFWGKGTGRNRRPWELDIGNAFLREYIVTLDSKRRITLQKA